MTLNAGPRRNPSNAAGIGAWMAQSDRLQPELIQR